jgi:tRNA G18 (ribose-2'-O)-methylase SpoU
MEELDRLSVDAFKETYKMPVTVVLDNVRSMHNVGSIFRTSDAFLVEKIILCGYTPRPPHRDINKTALGATETVAWEYVDATTTAILKLKRRGYWIAAIEQASESILLPEVKLPENTPVCVVFGSEVDGVDDDVLALCDAAIEIPQLGMKHSLNVSVAAGIVLFRLAESANIFQKK